MLQILHCACHATHIVTIHTTLCTLCCTCHTSTTTVSMLCSTNYAMHTTLYTLCCTYYTTHTLHSITQMLTTHAMISGLHHKCYTSHTMHDSTKRTVAYILYYTHFTYCVPFTIHATLRILNYTYCILHAVLILACCT